MADEGLNLEAWSMPHIGTLTRKVDFTKLVESFTFNDRFNDLSDGVFTIPDDATLTDGTLLKDKLLKVDEANHANDVGSMVRVLRGATPIAHFLTTRSEDSWSDGEPTSKFTVEGLEWILDRCLVPNYDHPADPTKEPDWIYGAPSILANSGLEDGGLSNLLIHVWVEDAVTAGTWTMTFPSQTTSALAFDIDAPALQTAIEALLNIQDIIITGAGTETNPWIIEVVDPAGTNFNVSISSAGLTGGSALFLLQTPGAVGVVDPWTRSFNPVTGLFHGTYTNFQISTAQAHTGTRSLYVKGALGSWPDSFPGAQQIVSVTGGRTYRAKIWVYPAFARTYRFVIRTADETFIGAVEAALTANSWQEMTVSVTIPDHVRSIIFRIACISNTDGHEFYVDDALLAPGFDAATLGKMLDDVRTAAIAVGSPLSWLTPTWTTTVDSDGAAWDQTRLWNVNHGQTFYQLIEYARKWNYEFRIRWDAGDARFEWDMWNPTGGGQTRAIAITGKSGVLGSAPIVRRPPGATYLKAEGDLGSWGEFASTTLDDVWGRLEKFHQDRQGVDSSELDELAERMVTRTETNTASRAITVADPSLLPWTSYEPGDIVTLNLAPKDTKKELRVAAIVASKGPSDAAPKYDVHFGSPVYSDEAAMVQGLKTVLREFRRPITTTTDGSKDPAFPLGGSAPTLVIAASNSSDSTKSRADFICLGTDDDLTFQTAVSQIYAGGGGRLLIGEGTYIFSSPVFCVQPSFIRFEGMGVKSSVIEMAAAANSHAFHVFTTAGGRVEFANLLMDGQKATQTSGSPAGINAPANGETELYIDNCEIKDFRGYGVFWVRHAGKFWCRGSIIHGNTIDGLHLNWEGYFFVSDSQIYSNGRHGIKADNAKFILVHNNLIFSNTNEGFSAGGSSMGDGQMLTDNHVTSNGGNGIALGGNGAVIAGNYCEDNAGHGISVDGVDSPSQVVGNYCRINDLSGFSFSGTVGGTCVGNVAQHNGQHGFILASTWHMKDNLAYSNSRTTDNTYDGINITGDNCSIVGNTIRQDAGANHHRYGINITATADATYCVANDARGSDTADYIDSGTNTVNTVAGPSGFGDNR